MVHSRDECLEVLHRICPPHYQIDYRAPMLGILLDVISESLGEPEGLSTRLPNGQSIRSWVIGAAHEADIYRRSDRPALRLIRGEGGDGE